MSTSEASINNVDLFFSNEIDQPVIDEIIELVEPELDNLHNVHNAMFNTFGSVNFDEITEALDSTYFNIERIADKWSIDFNLYDINVDECAFSIEFYFNK